MAVKVSKKLEKPPQLPEPIEELEDDLEDEEEETGGFTPVKASEVEKEAPVVSPPTKTPEFPTKVIKAKDSGIFWDWLASLSDEDWTKVNVYVYRQWPIINKRLVDPSANTNIEKYMGPFTEQTLKESHGSGEYKLMINDSSRTVGGKGGKVGEAYISVVDPMYPPLLDLQELVLSHPQNRSYVDQLKREGKLDMNGNPAVQQNNKGGENSDALTGLVEKLVNTLVSINRTPNPIPQKDNSTDAVIQMMAKTHEHSLNLVKDQIKGDDPEKLVKLMVAVAGMNKPDNSMEMFMKMQMEMARIQSESANSREALMMKLVELTNKPKEDNFDKELDKMMKFKELMGGGESEGGGRKKWYEVAIENGAPVLNSIIQGITQFIAVKTQVDAQQRQQQQAPQQGNMQHPTAAPQAIEEGSNVIEMPTQPQQPSPLIQYGGMVIAALQRGETGDKFASGVVRLIGPLAYKQIASVGKDAIITEMKGVPQFWQQMAPYEAVLEEFVTDFVECGGEEFMEDEQGGGE